MADIFIGINRGVQDMGPSQHATPDLGMVEAGATTGAELEIRIHSGVGWTRNEIDYVLDRIKEYLLDGRSTFFTL